MEAMGSLLEVLSVGSETVSNVCQALSDGSQIVGNLRQKPSFDSPTVNTSWQATPYNSATVGNSIPAAVYYHRGPLPAYPAYPQGLPMQNVQTPQQPGVFVVNNSQSQPQYPIVVVASPQRPSLVGHYLLSCCVLWCCNPLFGLIAFILAGKFHDDA